MVARPNARAAKVYLSIMSCGASRTVESTPGVMILFHAWKVKVQAHMTKQHPLRRYCSVSRDVMTRGSTKSDPDPASSSCRQGRLRPGLKLNHVATPCKFTHTRLPLLRMPSLSNTDFAIDTTPYNTMQTAKRKMPATTASQARAGLE